MQSSSNDGHHGQKKKSKLKHLMSFSFMSVRSCSLPGKPCGTQ